MRPSDGAGPLGLRFGLRAQGRAARSHGRTNSRTNGARPVSAQELCLIRFQPATEEEEVAYISLYSYFSSRGRFGVVANNSRHVKDLYLIPLSARDPVPSKLLPFEGPGKHQPSEPTCPRPQTPGPAPCHQWALWGLASGMWAAGPRGSLPQARVASGKSQEAGAPRSAHPQAAPAPGEHPLPLRARGTWGERWAEARPPRGLLAGPSPACCSRGRLQPASSRALVPRRGLLQRTAYTLAQACRGPRVTPGGQLLLTPKKVT